MLQQGCISNGCISSAMQFFGEKAKKTKQELFKFIQSWNKMMRTITMWREPFEVSCNEKSKGRFMEWKDPSKIISEHEFNLCGDSDWHHDRYAGWFIVSDAVIIRTSTKRDNGIYSTNNTHVWVMNSNRCLASYVSYSCDTKMW